MCVKHFHYVSSPTDPDGDPVIIRYTLDGTTVTTASPIWIPNTPPPTSNFTLKVKAYDDELASSNEVVRTYTNTNNPPLFSVTPAGPFVFNSAQNIQITATDDCSSNATIYYTTNGSTPTSSSLSAVNNLNLYLTTTTVIKFYVTDGQGNATPIQTHTYTLAVKLWVWRKYKRGLRYFYRQDNAPHCMLR
ncbi:MAG: chitobiase/beta-hexosaminidase C-terminal domain-containing protein [Saprospiraceae bacterium]|nr:chitobiase/beta-hexosaminidase C-terminal domain-containing protein [Saprospiraceae bacterium]